MLKITISGLGGREDHEVAEETTVGDLRALGLIAEGCTVRQGGQDIDDGTDVVEGAHYVTTPPAAKHG